VAVFLVILYFKTCKLVNVILQGGIRAEFATISSTSIGVTTQRK